MKFACYTLGCKVNQYETQAMEQLLVQSGHTLGSFDEICDGYIINTCTVTAVSDKKSRNAIRRVRKLNPAAAVGVCGCYAQSSPDEIRKLDVDVLIGTDGREAFVRHMIEAAATRQKWERVDDAGQPRAFEILPAGGLAARTRALLKVEDGCNNFCTYCIIPYARGPVRSLPLATAVAQTEQLRQEGYRELVLTGIETPAGAMTSRTAPVSLTFWRPSAQRRAICACGWAAWSPAPSPKISAAGLQGFPTCVLTSTCRCSPAATIPSGA